MDFKRNHWLAMLVVLVTVFGVSGCGDKSCLRSDEGCVVATPCSGLSFDCADTSLQASVIAPGDARPGGLAALASPGDFMLSNSVVVAVIDAIEHPHFVAPSGGSLIDLATVGDDNDSLNLVFQAVGFLPRDAAFYEEAELIEEADFVALQLHGHLDLFPDVHVHTRYEIRPCEPGIRVRTEFVNRSPDPLSWAVVDGWYWSGKETIPFAPGRGTGFDQAGLLDPIVDSFVPIPYMAAASHTEPSAAYSCIACNVSDLWGFQTEQLSANGTTPRIVPPRDYEVFERFIAVADGRSLAGATDVALEVRRQLFNEPWAEVSGRVRGNALGNEARATLHLIQGTSDQDPAERIPWSQVTPDDEGRFSVRVPADGDYVIELESFGRRIASWDTQVGSGPVDLGELEIPDAASIELSVTVDGIADHAQVFVHPADQETWEDVPGRLLGGFHRCAPMLGSSHGPSPACNRVLVRDPVTFSLPPGRYDLFATAGPFATLAMATVELDPGDHEVVDLALERLDLQPEGTLTADLHVHGSASFDSSIPDEDRVRAFLAAGIDVIAATDHDISHDYADAMAALDAYERIALMVGVETTGHILFDFTPGAELPQVIGHWNFWPLEYQPDSPYRGAIWDERAEPGLLITRMDEGSWSHDTGVVQLNHPWDEPEVGRDLGFPRALGVNALEPLPEAEDGSGPGVFRRVPEGASYANSDYHVQEVMNGSGNRLFLAYRAFWFYLLSQGVPRAGTANSDSHGLTDSVLGTPRNLIWTATDVASFDEDEFNASVRAGRMIGTNGPIIELSMLDAAGETRSPGIESFEPTVGGALSVRVSAAPWVPISEIRVVVNGEIVEILAAELSHPDNPYGTEGLVRFDDDIDLDSLLPSDGGDAWIVVEAGSPLADHGDLDCNGIPDTGDNNGDGAVDWQDVDHNDDDVVDEQDIEGRSAPTWCLEVVGPLAEPPAPEHDDDGYPFFAVTPESYPLAFTNPMLLDRDGGGYDGVGR